MKKFFAALISTLPLLVFSAVPITENGTPEAQIVLTSDAGESGPLAAKELQHWIKEISGAVLPIVNKADTSKSRIVLKRNPSLKLKADGYMISEPVKGKEIVIAAPTSRGILSGVWKLLFINTDIIWARPNAEYGTIFTQKKTLVFDKTSFKYDPVFLSRGFQYTGYFKDEEMWQARNGTNFSVNQVQKGKFLRELYDHGYCFHAEHNLVRLYFPRAKYWEKHPEYYALMNGKRVDPASKTTMTTLCFTNPECQKEFLKTFRRFVESNPQYDMIGVCIEDNWDDCTCPDCMKPVKLADGKEVTPKDKNFRSTRFFQWLLPAAEMLAKEYPGKRLKTNAYFQTEHAPACRLPENLEISYAPIYKDDKYAIDHPVNKDSMATYQAWLKTGATLKWRQYYGLTEEFPRPVDTIMAEDLKYAHKQKITQIHTEMRHDREFLDWHGHFVWDQNSMYFYVMAHLNEDPYRPVEEIRNEFLTRVYGEAAPYVKEYYVLTEKAWFKLKQKSQWDDQAQAKWNRILAGDPALQGKLASLLAKAKQCRMHPHARKMLERLTASFEKMSHPKKTYIYARKAKEKVEFTDPLFSQGAWKDVPAEENFLPDRRVRHLKLPTRMKLLYDDLNLYVAFRCTDSNGEKVYAEKAKSFRDRWPRGNKIELLMGAADGTRVWLVFDTNGNIMDVRGANNVWNWFFNIPIRKDAAGWSALVTIPFGILGWNPAKDPEIPFYPIRYYMDNVTKDRGTFDFMVKVRPWEPSLFPVLKLAKDGERIPPPVRPAIAVPASWRAEKGNQAEVAYTENGEMLFRNTMKDAQEKRVFWMRDPIGRIAAGKMYRVTFKARAVKPLEATVTVECSAPWQAVSKRFQLAPEWKTYTLDFSMKPFKRSPYFLFWLKTPGTAEFIPVSLGECTEPVANLVQNASFEKLNKQGVPAAWSPGKDAKPERVALPDGKFGVKLSGKGKALNLAQWSVRIKPQTDYELSVRVQGKKGTIARAYVECNKPWAGCSKRITCDGTWQEIRVPVKFAKLERLPYFVIGLGNEGEAVFTEPKIVLKDKTTVK